MTVKELIDRLKRIPDKDQEIIMSCDEEGNGFAQIDDEICSGEDYGYKYDGYILYPGEGKELDF